MGIDLIAIAAEGKQTRHYISPNVEQRQAAAVIRPTDVPDAPQPSNARDFKTPNYGLTQFSDLFTSRQLLALTTLSDLVLEARQRAHEDALAAEMSTETQGGVGAEARADAVATYLGLSVSKLTDRNSTITNWYVSRESTSSTFARQAIPMTWDFAETYPLGVNTGSFYNAYSWTAKALSELGGTTLAQVTQHSAQTVDFSSALLSTDPPYYDNIGYSDLSDYFYIWLRRSLQSVYPDLLSTMLVPKQEELVANPYRHDGREGAQQYFEDGFVGVFRRARESAVDDYPIAVYYAFKQSETTSQGQSSTGWETVLEGMIGSGWRITATWPVRSEASNRMVGQGRNALASSIVLTLRPRPDLAPRTARRGFVAALKAELPRALRELQQGAIAPVDLPQAAIGPGMTVFSRYSAVLSDDGTPMRVRDALSLINEVLDDVLSEQEGDFDADTRFALAWFRQHGFEAGDFGDADNLARARNASLEHLDRAGILTLRGTRGKVTLLAPSSLAPEWDPATDQSISAWEVVMHLSRTLTENGVVAASALLTRVPESIDRDLCKELAFLLFALAEDAKRTKVAVEFNALGTAWNDIAAGVGPFAEQGTFDYTGD